MAQLGRWKLNGAVAAAAYTNETLTDDLTPSGPPAVVAGVLGNGRSFTAGQYAVRSPVTSPGGWTGLRNNFTLLWWYKRAAAPAAGGEVVMQVRGHPVSGAGVAGGNILMQATWKPTALELYYETGVRTGHTASVSVTAPYDASAWHLLSLEREQLSGAQFNLKARVNGVLVATTLVTDIPGTGGDTNTLVLLGAAMDEAGAIAATLTGAIDEPRLYDAIVGEAFIVAVAVEPIPAGVPESSALPPVEAADASTFGLDVSVFPDLDASFALVSGARVLAEAIAKRLSTPRGGLAFHPDYGFDLRGYLSELITDDTLHEVKAGVQQEAEADERVAAADVAVSYSHDTRQLSVKVELSTDDGPFEFTLAVTELDVSVLTVEAA